MKLLTVIGARPQFVKAAALSRAIAASINRPRRPPLQECLVHTGQHYDSAMSEVFFTELNLAPPAYHLGVGSGPHGRQTGRMLERLEAVMMQERPDRVVVYGDTNSTLGGALAAVKLRIPVVHVEAGLRSYNRAMPEEINRVLVDHCAALLFCPTERAVKNLSGEGILKGVHLVGDVMYDSLRHHLDRAGDGRDVLVRMGVSAGGYALATVHRAELTDRPEVLQALLQALGGIGVPVIVPLHPRSRDVLAKHGVGLRLPETVRLVAPVPYGDMVALERHAKLILTDSGGVQKEAFWLRVPCVTLRAETEWLETLEGGWNRLAGTESDRVVRAAHEALACRPTEPFPFFGDGRAAERMLDILSG
jgi:UDP-N-acetylglucosamine 2-epimerase